MGLDMMLNAEKFVWGDDDRKKIGDVIKEIYPELKGSELQHFSVEVGYWRKANQIHSWFVENCQRGVDECQETNITKDNLIELLDICERIKENTGLAAELLPASTGFFFGSEEYDEYYFQNIDDTIDILKRAIPLFENYDITYRSSW